MSSKPAPIIGEVEWFKRLAVPAPASRKAGPSGRGGRAPSKSMHNHMWRVMGGSNTAVLKKIRNAGTHHPKQLAGQMAYLNGKADLVFGNGIDYELGDAALSSDAVENMIEQWSEGWKGQPKNGHTTHLVLSFPGYVSGEQAARIVEEWCEDMFQATDAGLDEWAYYAAVHLDQPHHPHVHVIVNNRGLRNGDWFYMAEGHDFSYQNMKQRMVEISETHDVYLDATSRLERGIIEYAPRDAEYRRSIRMGLEPKGRGREGEALDAAYATLKAYAEQCQVMAIVAENIDQHALAANLRAAATDLENARPIHRPGDLKMEIDLTQHPADIRSALNEWALKNEEKIAALNPNDRKEVTDQLHKTLDHIETVLDRDYQVVWTPPAAELPAFSQPYASAVLGDAERLFKRAAEYEEYIDAIQPHTADTNIKLETVDLDALKQATIQQGVEAEIANYKAMGYSRDSIGGQLPELEERVEARVALAEARGEELGSWDHLVKADQLEEVRELDIEARAQDMASFRESGVLERYISTGERPQVYAAQFEAVEAAYADLSSGSLADGPQAMQSIRQDVAEAGLDPDRFQSRMERGAVNAREEEEWMVNDIETVMAHQGLDATNPEHVSSATAVVRALQDSIAVRMDDIYSRHHEVNQVELRTTALQVAREVETYGVAAFASSEAEQKFMQQMRATYGSVGIMEMANNHPEMLKDITENEAEQRAIIYAVLKHEEQHHDLGLSKTMTAEGLELNNPRPGHEIDGHSL